MRYLYKNITTTGKLLSLLSQDRHSVSHIPVGPSTTIELEYPGLDLYLPHILALINESGQDITHLVLRELEENKKAASKVAPVPNKPFVFPTNQTTAVKPGIYVDNKVEEVVKTEAVKVEVKAPVIESVPVVETSTETVEAVSAPVEKATTKKGK